MQDDYVTVVEDKRYYNVRKISSPTYIWRKMAQSHGLFATAKLLVIHRGRVARIVPG